MIGIAWVGRHSRSLLLFAAALLAQPASAFCEISAASTTNVAVTRGGSVTLGYDVAGPSCVAPIVTDVSVVADGTGLSSVTADVLTGGAGRRSITAFVGSTPGFLELRVTCTSGCVGPTANLTIDYTIEATVARNLSVVGPATFTEEAGATRTMTVIADDDGSPAGTTVQFDTTGPASVSPAVVNTDPSGSASVTATFGPGTGTAVITARRIDRLDAPVSFNVDVIAVAPRALLKISGDSEAAQTEGNLGPLVVEARNAGSAAPGVGIDWSIVSGDATFSATTSTTDAGGRAEAELLLGPAEGPIVVRATRVDDPSVVAEFNVSSFITRFLLPVSGDDQTDVVGSVLPLPLVVEAINNSSPVAGVGVVWSIVSGGGTLVAPTTTTDANGRAQTQLQLPGSPGPVVVTAIRADDGDIIASFNATAVLPPPRAILRVSGDGQSGQTGTAIAAPLVLETRDAGVPAAGVGITWSVVAGDATLVAPSTTTDGSARAQTGVLFGPSPGIVTVRAVRDDDPSVGVNFNLLSYATRTLTVVSGNNQSGPPDSILPQPLVAELRDNGVPKPGVSVTWTVTSGGALPQFLRLITDANGRVDAIIRLPTSVGPSVITVNVVGDPSTSLAFTVNSGTVVRTLAAISGDGQSSPVGSPLPAPLVVESRDNGVAAPGVGITWSVLSGDASLVGPTSPSDAGGRAQTGLLFGPTAGPVVVRAARVDDPSATVDFTVASSGIVRTLDLVSGNGQTAAARAPLPAPLVVEARNNGLPATALAIDWAVVSGDATLAAAGSITDGTGRTQNTLTLGPTPGPIVVRATRADDPGIVVEFTVTSTLTRTLAIAGGDGQSATTRTALPQPLVVEARDNGLPAVGTGISWSVVSGDAVLVSPTSAADASGRAQAGLRFGATPGPVLVRATRVDDPTLSVQFALSSTLTRTLSIVAGDGQSAPTRRTLAQPLVVEARDNGQGAAGVGIAWSVVSGDATLVSPSATTDASGRAQTGLQFGATPGAVVVRATRADDAGVRIDFTLTSTFTRTISVLSGANQQGLAGLPLPDPLVIEVRANGEPEAGVGVEISISGDASVSDAGPPSTKLLRTTGADGRVSAVITLGPTAGTVGIRASVPSTPGLTATVAATAGTLANVPGLPEPLRDVGGVVQQACAAIARLPASGRTPEQADLLARCQSFAGVPGGPLGDALDALLPDLSLAMVSVGLQAGQAQLDNLKARLAALRSGTQGQRFGGLAVATPFGPVPFDSAFEAMLGPADTGEAGAGFARWGWFLSGTLGRGEYEAGRRTPAFDFDLNGLTAGLDYRFSDQLVAGASLGYTRQDIDLDGDRGRVDASGYSVSAYATWYRDSGYADGVLTWGRNDYDTLRRIRYTLPGPGGVSTVDQPARSRLDGDLLSIAATVGRDYSAKGWTVGPYGRLLYTRIAFDSAREVVGTGAGSGFALELFPGEHTSFASVVGTKFSTAISRDWGVLMPHLQLEWEREYRDDPQRVGARFLADPGAMRFSVDGDPVDRSFFRLGAGLSLLFAGGRSGFLYVERVVGKSGFTQTNVALGLRGEF